MQMSFKFILCLVFYLVSGEIKFEIVDNKISESPVVTISDGKIRGTMNQTVGDNTTFYAFRGIPYAEPPVGDLRFAAPVKNSIWNDTLNATDDKSQCVQGYNPVTGSEDCLYINVYVPKVETQSNLSVMVWIYGGSFISGNSTYENYGPDYLLDQGVIFVSFNYRVGVFGWISTGDLTCPGNWGLKDQILALRWVKENIANFTGNPNNITVFGQSAGAASVSLLLQTNATKDLINAAIMESGTSLNLWGRNIKAARIAFKIGLAFAVITADSSTLIESLRRKDYETLQAVSYITGLTIMLENALEGLFFAPVIEPPHEGAALVKASQQVLREGGMHRVPQIIGYNSNEAAAVGDIPAYLKLYLLTYDVAFINLAPTNMTSNITNRLLAATEIRTKYYGVLSLAAQPVNVVKFTSEDQFERPIRSAANLTGHYADVFFYTFSHEGILSGVTDRNFTGVGHGEEVKYIFRTSNDYTTADVETRSRIVKMWTNFAKYGNPTPSEDVLLQNLTWPKLNVTSGNHTYLNINTTLSVDQNPNQRAWDFYKHIYDTYEEYPHDTY